MPKHVLVTGSSGMIGTRLMERLRDAGIVATGVDIKPNRWDAEIGGRTIRLDLRDTAASLAQLPTDADMVIHLAAHARVFDLIQRPELARENVETTFTALEYARARKIPILFASSREVYGDTSEAAHREDDVHLERSENPYTASKMSGEAFVWAYRRCYGVPSLTLRFANAYGMYDLHDRVIPLFIRRSREGKELVVYGKGKTLDFIHIDDAVSGIMRAVERFDVAKDNVYNIASGVGTTVLQIAELVSKAFGRSASVHIEENRTGEVMACVADTALARERLGFEPTIGIEEGIARTVDWYRSHDV
ncbi:NAD-dependent epimerase/dehydratase family protein [Candidatus Uhrbacteria bacterium]|nr:NAD-dependent epimerase/dehydratase family protein [Candidatus Uhrbacteria bacterium]